MIGLAEWHIHTHTGGRTRTALRQVLAQIAPTVNGRLVVISADGDGPAVVTCYADPHGLDPRSSRTVATFAEAQAIGDAWLRAWRDDWVGPSVSNPYEFAYWRGDEPYWRGDER
jgi:hypothetical protein